MMRVHITNAVASAVRRLYRASFSARLLAAAREVVSGAGRLLLRLAHVALYPLRQGRGEVQDGRGHLHAAGTDTGADGRSRGVSVESICVCVSFLQTETTVAGKFKPGVQSFVNRLDLTGYD